MGDFCRFLTLPVISGRKPLPTIIPTRTGRTADYDQPPFPGCGKAQPGRVQVELLPATAVERGQECGCETYLPRGEVQKSI